MLAAVCRIGHKYEVTEAVDVAVKRIRDFFKAYKVTPVPRYQTTTAMTWDAYWEDYQKRQRVNMELGDAIEAVNLHRLLGQPGVLEFALCLCCAGGPLYLRNGTTREDGTVEKLTDEDYIRCIEAIS